MTTQWTKTIARQFICFMLCVFVLSVHGSEREPAPSPGKLSPALRSFLQTKLSDHGIEPDHTTKVSLAFIDIGHGAKEILVYISSNGWCGSGGCTLLFLESNGSSYKVIGRTTIVQLPIRVIVKKSNGLPDIGVWVQGGGIMNGYEAILSFNGHKYPSNPSVPPAQKSTVATVGKVVISEKDISEPLYQ